MDTNTVIFIVGSAVGGILIGGIVGYLIAIRKFNEAETRATRFETMSKGFHDQIAGKDAEIARLNEQDARKQELLLEAQASKTKAETELAEANGSVESLAEEIESYKAEIASFSNANTSLKELNAKLQANFDAAQVSIREQKEFLAEANTALQDAFSSLSSEALRKNNVSFLESAKETLEAKVKESAADLETRKTAIETLVKPLSESLKDFDGKLNAIEIKREGAYKEMSTMLDVMKGTTDQLNVGTKQLVSALKTSHVRGRYGEIGLRRIVEAAGLTKYCDFVEQESVTTEAGRLRPDMTVRLPGHRELVLDSKVPLSAYLRTFETEDESEQAECLRLHAVAVRDHLKKLGQKSYWEKFSESPDFVIMYMHIESSYGAALMTDSDLIIEALNHNIVFATPSTLIGMLRTVGFMWQQERMAENIIQIRDAGIELYKRANTMLGHFSKVGAGLNSAVNSYNSAVGSVETRVLTQLERIRDVGGTLIKEPPNAPKHIEVSAREVTKSLPPIAGVPEDDLERELSTLLDNLDKTI